LVYQQTQSAGLTALTYAFTYLPSLLGGAVLSGLADRYPRRELMVVVDVCRAVAAGAMALPVLPLPVLMGLVFVLTLAGSPFKAAQQALLPTVLQGDLYVTGLALRTVTNQSAQLAGFLGGGALLVVLDPYVALGLNAATFLVAAAVVALGVRRRPAARAAESADGEEVRGTAGVARLIWRDRQLRWLTTVSWLVGLFVVPEGLAAPYAASLGAGTLAIGVLLAADPVGSVVGAWLITRLPDRIRVSLITPLAIAAGIPLVVCVVRPSLVASVVLWAVSGACSTAYVILAQASFTRQVPDHCRGSATGLVSTGLLTSQGVAMLGGGALADVTSPAMAIAGAGAAGAVLAGVVGASWRSSRAAPSDDAESVARPVAP
jgi:MFS family permease